ncbi:hypothetical protein H6758_00520 [Candidatus Nomurabacteria bacterium]|nr:hypothetical protein [Candidatus Nomurabacteria bacterium]
MCAGTVYVPKVDAALEDALVGYWKFDEVSGTISYDSSGHGNNGSFVGTPDISTTVPTLEVTNVRSLDFNGSTDYVTMGDQSILEVEDGPFSISLWFRPDGAPGPEASWVFVAKGTPSSAGYAFQYEQVGGQYVINISKY